jgi:hypothetical protein
LRRMKSSKLNLAPNRIGYYYKSIRRNGSPTCFRMNVSTVRYWCGCRFGGKAATESRKSTIYSGKVSRLRLISVWPTKSSFLLVHRELVRPLSQGL